MKMVVVSSKSAHSPTKLPNTVLQIRRGNRDNLGIIFHITRHML